MAQALSEHQQATQGSEGNHNAHMCTFNIETFVCHSTIKFLHMPDQFDCGLG